MTRDIKVQFMQFVQIPTSIEWEFVILFLLQYSGRIFRNYYCSNIWLFEVIVREKCLQTKSIVYTKKNRKKNHRVKLGVREGGCYFRLFRSASFLSYLQHLTLLSADNSRPTLAGWLYVALPEYCALMYIIHRTTNNKYRIVYILVQRP